MNTRLARNSAALFVLASFGFAGSALAQDKNIKIGVLNDM